MVKFPYGPTTTTWPTVTPKTHIWLIAYKKAHVTVSSIIIVWQVIYLLLRAIVENCEKDMKPAMGIKNR